MSKINIKFLEYINLNAYFILLKSSFIFKNINLIFNKKKKKIDSTQNIIIIIII